MENEPNANPPANPTPAPAQQTPNVPTESQAGVKNEPDTKQAYERVKSELADYKQRYSDLEAKLKDGLKPEDLEAVRTEAKTEREALEAKHAGELLQASVDLALISAGCRDTAAAKAHIDLAKLTLKDGKVEGLDTADLAKTYPYLFQTTAPKDVGAPPAGTPDKDAGVLAKMREAAGLKVSE